MGLVCRKGEVNANHIHVKGCFNDTCKPATSIPHTVGKKVHHFVHLSKHALWFRKGVAGKHCRKGDLKAVNVMSEIRQRFLGDAAIQTIAAVAADAEKEEEDKDDAINR